MTDKPHGALHPDYGPFFRDAKEIAPGVWFGESQRGTKGSGKMWYPSVVRLRPDAGKPDGMGKPLPQFHEFGCVRPFTGKYTTTTHKLTMWGYTDPNDRTTHRGVEAYFCSELVAVQFMLRNASELFK